MINKKPLFRHLTQREWRGCWTCLIWRSSPPRPYPPASGAGAGTALGQGSTSPACRWMEDRLSLVTKQWHVLFIAGKWRSRGEQGNLGQEWHGGAGWRHGLDHWQLGLQSRGVHSLRAGEDEVQAVWRVSRDKDEPARGNFPPREDDGESCQGGQQFSVLCFKRTYLFCCTFPWNIFRIAPRAFIVTITLELFCRQQRDDNDPDYVNANYVDGYKERNAFMQVRMGFNWRECSLDELSMSISWLQGPLPRHTFYGFWFYQLPF